jgi:nicotinate dehydrogenase subunit B
MTTTFTRREFLKAGGALVVAFSLPLSLPRGVNAAEGASFPTVSPGALDSWLAVNADGTVTVFTGRVELGQGNETALVQIIAEELDVPFSAVRMVVLPAALPSALPVRNCGRPAPKRGARCSISRRNAWACRPRNSLSPPAS